MLYKTPQAILHFIETIHLQFDKKGKMSREKKGGQLHEMLRTV